MYFEIAETPCKGDVLILADDGFAAPPALADDSTQLLRDAGYAIGYQGKPWSPGNSEVSGWKENPVGPKFSGLDAFLKPAAALAVLDMGELNADRGAVGGLQLRDDFAQGQRRRFMP